MRRLLTRFALAIAVSGCSVVAPEYTEPAATVAPARTPTVQAVTYKVVPLGFAGGAAASVVKTAIAFSNPSSTLMDWSMVVNLKLPDGTALRQERIGSAGVRTDRADSKWQNWYFPIPPGESWTLVRFDTFFAGSDVESFQTGPSTGALSEIDGVRAGTYNCFDDVDVKVLGCKVTITTSADVPAFTRLHLVVLFTNPGAPPPLIRAMQWRPELLGGDSPWMNLRAGEKVEIDMHDSYPSPPAGWQATVVVHAYQFSRPG